MQANTKRDTNQGIRAKCAHVGTIRSKTHSVLLCHKPLASPPPQPTLMASKVPNTQTSTQWCQWSSHAPPSVASKNMHYQLSTSCSHPARRKEQGARSHSRSRAKFVEVVKTVKRNALRLLPLYSSTFHQTNVESARSRLAPTRPCRP